MSTVGVRELRASLSKHLDEVKDGGTVTVTEHGRPIARIVPHDGPSTYERLVTEGLITPAEDTSGRLPDLVKANGTVSDLVALQRR